MKQIVRKILLLVLLLMCSVVMMALATDYTDEYASPCSLW